MVKRYGLQLGLPYLYNDKYAQSLVEKKHTLLGQGRGMIFVYKARPEMGNPAVSRANHLYLTYHLCPRNYQSYTVPISICLCGHVGL